MKLGDGMYRWPRSARTLSNYRRLGCRTAHLSRHSLSPPPPSPSLFIFSLLKPLFDILSPALDSWFGRWGIVCVFVVSVLPIFCHTFRSQGHLFRCLPKTVALMFQYLEEHPAKRELVNQMAFGTPYENRVVGKRLSQEDKDTDKIFQGKTAVALTDLVKTTPADTDENRKLFMQAFILFIQKVFLLPNSTANIVQSALNTIFDLESTSKRNWALHVHDFLL
ncbi:hypothetical protein PIB30_055788 [Stylosanthes scabra]|uniref:Uncharacterized protein n=1 Tax=Stylosanthes scabra TaxID=79078 RepID=A0ABU6ZHV5_9FABA|nr:hypothetical protein [Stylosanthes scabra]